MVHHHQPVGNLNEAVRKAVQGAYLPVLEALEAGGLPVTLHYSGALLEWLSDHEPTTLERIGKLVSSHRAELLGGPMYAPLLPLLSNDDVIGQCQMLSDWLEERFAVRPRAAWLPEFAWEPTLPSPLRASGLEFALLDDTQFVASGVPTRSLNAPFVTDDGEKVLTLVPVASELSSSIGFTSEKHVLESLRSHAQHGGMLVLGLHAERLNTKNALEHFQKFLALLETTEFLTPCTLSQALEQHPAQQHVFLPTSTSRHLAQWTSPPETARALEQAHLPKLESFVRGGSWRSFLSKYPEIHHLARRTAHVSRKLAETPRAPESAWRSLYRAQSGNAFWHGGADGVMANYLRSSAYRHLIEAENASEPRKYGWLEIEYADFDVDGHDEVIAESNTINAYFDPQRGGAITELDQRDRAVNVCDTFARWREALHFEHPELRTDTHPRHSLLDHFIGAESTFQEFERGDALELGDFVTGAFEAGKYRDRVTLQRQGFVRGPVGEPVPVELKKAVRFKPKESRLEIEYRIDNLGHTDIITRFGSEWNFGLLVPDAPDRAVLVNDRIVGNFGSSLDVIARTYTLRDPFLGLEMQFDFGKEVLVWQHPILTSNLRDGHLEHRYQSTLVLPLWDLDLPMGRSRRIAYSLTLKAL